MIINFKIENNSRIVENIRSEVSNLRVSELIKKNPGIYSYDNKIWKEYKFLKIKNEVRNYSLVPETLWEDVLDLLCCLPIFRFILKTYKNENIELFVSLNINDSNPSLYQLMINDRPVKITERGYDNFVFRNQLPWEIKIFK